MAKNVLIKLLLIALIILSCLFYLMTGTGVNSIFNLESKDVLWQSMNGDKFVINRVHKNYYEAFGFYKEYGVIIYTRDSESDSNMTVNDLMTDSIRKMKYKYGEAYTKGKLERWCDITNKPVPFNPKYICLLIHDKQHLNYEGVILESKNIFNCDNHLLTNYHNTSMFTHSYLVNIDQSNLPYSFITYMIKDHIQKEANK